MIIYWKHYVYIKQKQKNSHADIRVLPRGTPQILLKFSKKFWPSNHGLVVCSDSFVSQYWTFEADPAAPPVIAGFCTGDQARNIGSMSHDVVVDTFLKQLDAIYASTQNGVAPGESEVRVVHVCMYVL